GGSPPPSRQNWRGGEWAPHLPDILRSADGRGSHAAEATGRSARAWPAPKPAGAGGTPGATRALPSAAAAAPLGAPRAGQAGAWAGPAPERALPGQFQ